MPELHPSPVILLPQIVIADELESSLPLEQTTVNAQVTGPVASVVVTQRFGNPLKEPAELDYLFPLPEDAAITGFELKIGQRSIMGDLQESETARNAYEEAMQQGKRSGLLEQRRPNLFAVRLANVQAGETIHATVRYQQKLKFEEDANGGGYEFVYPMGLTPKYDSPTHPQEKEGVHAPVAKSGEKIGPVEINVSIDAGVPAGEPVSPSHPLEVTRIDERRWQVRLAGEQIPDHDFVLRYPVSGKQAQAAAWTSGEAGKAFFLAALTPPRMEDEITPLPREFIFVLDRSGSMSGEPIKQARNALRACLRTLGEGDTFRILLFDNEIEWFQSEPAVVTQDQVEKADRYLDRVEGRGGTEIIGALDAVLSLPPDAKRTRFIVFLTDGAVSAEARLFDGIRKRLGSARLFTFGIGPSVNRALLNRMATLGRGRSTFLQLNEDIEGAIIRFQDSVTFPAITDITLEWENAKAWDIYPARLPDLYYGQPLEIYGRLAASAARPAVLTVRGKCGDQPVVLQLTLPQNGGQEPAIERLWARARVDDLLDQMEMEPNRADKLRADILGLALEYNLVTTLTSFVAIDQSPATEGGKPRTIKVAQPLPQGLQPGGFGMGPVAPMATMAAFMPTASAPMPRAKSTGSLSDSVADLLSSVIPARKQRMQSKRANQQTLGAALPMDAAAPEEGAEDRESVLRWLARTQKLDGSWGGDGEWTAAALIAFVRAGHTTRSGSYRQALRRAARWLAENPGEGFARFARARALEELAAETGDSADRSAAQAGRLVLSAPASKLDQAAVGQPVPPPAEIKTLDDLRLAALLRVNLPVPAALLRGPQADLARTWAAALPD